MFIDSPSEPGVQHQKILIETNRSSAYNNIFNQPIPITYKQYKGKGIWTPSRQLTIILGRELYKNSRLRTVI